LKTYIALLRGINVGGKNALPMKELVSIMENNGAENVNTYIQSGNAVFQTDLKNIAQLPGLWSAEIRQGFGFEPHIQILKIEALNLAIAQNPFPQAEADPSSLHLSFLAARPDNPDLQKLNSIKKPSEKFVLIDQVFYLHAPEGIGTSKLAAGIEKILGVPMTGRNWKSVCSIRALAKY